MLASLSGAAGTNLDFLNRADGVTLLHGGRQLTITGQNWRSLNDAAAEWLGARVGEVQLIAGKAQAQLKPPAKGQRPRAGAGRTYVGVMDMNATRSVRTVRAHHFIFIGGFPHSGTSLMDRVLRTSALASGMGECKRATMCHRTNEEGQWLLFGVHPELSDPSSLYNNVGRGQRVPRQPNATADALVLVAAWSTWWNLSRPLLVEKSPSNIVRIAWLDAAFRVGARAAGMRQVIMLKDPATNKRAQCFAAEKQDGHALPCAPARANATFGARLDFMREWLESFEGVERAVTRSGSGAPVLVVPYDELLEPATCRPLLEWSVGGHPQATAAADEACAARVFYRAGDRAGDRAEAAVGGTRRLGYRHQNNGEESYGGDVEDLRVMIDADNERAELRKRRAAWLRDVSACGSSQGAEVRARLEDLDRRTGRFGYRLIGNMVPAPRDGVLAPWMLPRDLLTGAVKRDTQ
jgi:hypothetical protein